MALAVALKMTAVKGHPAFDTVEKDAVVAMGWSATCLLLVRSKMA
jgi:hypothetical protein